MGGLGGLMDKLPSIGGVNLAQMGGAQSAAEKQFKSDGWCSVKALGFDQYFVLRGNVVDTDAAMDAFEQKDASTMTATQIKNAYMKAVESRNGARGMIHRFVKTVA